MLLEGSGEIFDVGEARKGGYGRKRLVRGEEELLGILHSLRRYVFHNGYAEFPLKMLCQGDGGAMEAAGYVGEGYLAAEICFHIIFHKSADALLLDEEGLISRKMLGKESEDATEGGYLLFGKMLHLFKIDSYIFHVHRGKYLSDHIFNVCIGEGGGVYSH